MFNAFAVKTFCIGRLESVTAELEHHSRSVVKTLPPLFPCIGMMFARFRLVPQPVTRRRTPQIRFGAGVPRDVEVIYERGLQWLAANQTTAGNWSGGDSGPGITGMCVMAFIASGDDPNFGKYSENIRRAVRSMIQTQDASTGYFQTSMYHHGFAMLGMSEVYGVLDEDSLWTKGDTSNRRTIGESWSWQCAAR